MGRNNFFKKNQKNLFLSEKNDWKKIEKNNVTIVLNIFACEKEKKLSCLCSKKQFKS